MPTHDIRLVGRLFVSKASVKEGTSADKLQVYKAKGLNYSLYAHSL